MSNSLLIFFFILECSFGIGVSNKVFYVTGGRRENVRTNLMPHVVSLRFELLDKIYGSGHFCGGTIVSHRAILTAAHCFYNTITGKFISKRIIVVAGSIYRIRKEESARVYNVGRVIVHHDYNHDTNLNDIAILKLTYNLDINAHTKIAKLPSVAPKQRQVCSVFGWGKIFEGGPMTDKLGYAELTIHAPEVCMSVYWFYSTEGMVCAMSKPFDAMDACTGDSGGPLFCGNYLAGIIAFGIGCGKEGMPAGYTDVLFYNDWILENCVANKFEAISLILLQQVLLILI